MTEIYKYNKINYLIIIGPKLMILGLILKILKILIQNDFRFDSENSKILKILIQTKK